AADFAVRARHEYDCRCHLRRTISSPTATGRRQRPQATVRYTPHEAEHSSTLASARAAGPPMTRPVRSNVEPWQGQKKSCPRNCTEQHMCVQEADSATSVPDEVWATMIASRL